MKDRQDIDGNPVTLEKLCRLEPAWAASRIRVMEFRLARLSEWTHQYGSRLCPSAGYADTFGDGVRASKDSVRELLEAADAVR